MISIRLKNYNGGPRRLTCYGSRKQIRRAAETKSGAVCTGNYYRDDTVLKLLKSYSLGKKSLNKSDCPKCFYCESQGEQMLPLEVDHYRPKDGLAKIDLDPGQQHEGYYWLANEWSNLILSCRACNKNGAKGIRFPIFNNSNRVPHDQPVNNKFKLNRKICKLNSKGLLDESPILLNPEFDTPEIHLTFDDKGHIYSIKGGIRGELTIKILRLDRDPLLIAKQKIIKEFVNDINALIVSRKLNKIDSDTNLKTFFELICQRIISRRKVNTSYTLWGRYLNDNIENVIIKKIPTSFRQLFRNAYEYARLNPTLNDL